MGLKKLGGFENLPTVDLARDGEGTVTKFKLLNLKQVKSKFDPSKISTVYTIEMDGEKAQFWGGTVLDRILEEAELGSNLVIKYLGEEPSKDRGKQPFKNFEAFVDDPTYDQDDSKTETTTGAPKKKPF